MAKFRSIKNSFIAGQISPTAFGRTDLPQYAHGCKLMKNMIPLLSGGAYRRPGSFFEQKYDESAESAPGLYPFAFSQDESYCVAFRKLKNGTKPITIFKPSSARNYYKATQYTATGQHSFTRLNDLQYAQSADVMWFVYKGNKPKKLKRSTGPAFTFVDFDDGLTGDALRDAWPYRTKNTTAVTITPSHTSGTGRTLTASSAIFYPSHVGAMFKILDGGVVGCAKITGVVGSPSTEATVDIVRDFGGVGASANWWESSWSDYRGWPRTVGFFQDRIVYAGNDDSLWFSQTANYDVMSVSTISEPLSGPTGAQPFTIQLGSQQVNEIQWISPESTLVVGTLGSEWIIDRETAGAGFGGDNAAVYLKTRYGSSYKKAVRAGNELMFSLPSGDEVRSLVFTESEQTYTAEPIQLLFDEYPGLPPSWSYTFRKEYSRFEWDESRKTLWCCDTAGNFFGLTRDRKLGVTTWHTHELGGYNASPSLIADSPTGLPSGSILSMCVVPNPILGVNDVWLVVQRGVKNAFHYDIERITGKQPNASTAYNLSLGVSGNFYTDASAYDTNGYPAVTRTVSGLDHLEGSTVVGTANNLYGLFKMPEATVVSGDVTITSGEPYGYDDDLVAMVYGLPFTSIVAPVKTDAGSVIGTSQAAIKRIHKLTVNLYRTLSCKVGRDLDNLERIEFRTSSTPTEKSAELFTGDKVVNFDGDYDRDGYVYIVQDEPLPFTIISLVAEGMTYD